LLALSLSFILCYPFDFRLSG